MATFNVLGYVQVYKPMVPHIHVSLARWNEYKYFIFQDRAKYKNKFMPQNFF